MIIEAPIAKVWAAVRAFDGVAKWNPAVTAARLERGGPTEVGALRLLDIADGTSFRETLLAHSDLEHFYSYDIIESPLPVTDYVSTHRFLAVTESDQTLSIWESSFRCAEDRRAEMEQIVGDAIYAGGMRGLNAFMKEI